MPPLLDKCNLKTITTKNPHNTQQPCQFSLETKKDPERDKSTMLSSRATQDGDQDCDLSTREGNAQLPQVLGQRRQQDKTLPQN